MGGGKCNGTKSRNLGSHKNVGVLRLRRSFTSWSSGCAQDDNIIIFVSGLPRSLLLSNQSPPARPSYKDGIVPTPAPAPCLRSGGDGVSTPPEWFVSRRLARGRLAGRCQMRRTPARSQKRAVPAPRS